MADYGIRISRDGQNVLDQLLETNKKNFIALSDTNSPKILFSGFLESKDPPFSAIEYKHNLGYVPMFFLFLTDSTTNPTYFSMTTNTVSTTTKISQYPGTYAYLIILQEGQ